MVGSELESPFWEHVRQILNPESSIGAEPWVYYSIYAFFVFLLNIFDIVSFFLTLCYIVEFLCATRKRYILSTLLSWFPSHLG